MDDYVKILESSFHLAIDQVGEEVMGAMLFDKFFTLYPETRSYFVGTDVNYFGGKKLNIIFIFIRDIVKFPNFSAGHISQEIMRHQMYGLEDKEYYFGLIDSFVMMMKETLATDWVEEYEIAWNDTSQAFKSLVAEAVDAYI